jgi:hemerythrin
MLEWKDSYSVGVASLDKQHKDMINMINSLPTCKDFGETIKFLKTYVEEHFFDEEHLMSAGHYVGLQAHIEGHAEFIAWLNDLQIKIAASTHNVQDLITETHTYLSQWLISHILETDRLYIGKIPKFD